MINFISSWAKGIIVAIIIASIFEMILPNSKNKKYIKTVIGIYILFNIVSPVIGKIMNSTQSSLEISQFMDFDTYVNEANRSDIIKDNLDTNNEENIKKLYITKLESDIKCKIENLDYIVKEVKIILDNNEKYDVKRLDLKIVKKAIKESSSINDNKNEVSNNIVSIKPIDEISFDFDDNSKNKNDDEYEDNIQSISKNEIDNVKKFLNNTYDIKIQNIFIN